MTFYVRAQDCILPMICRQFCMWFLDILGKFSNTTWIAPVIAFQLITSKCRQGDLAGWKPCSCLCQTCALVKIKPNPSSTRSAWNRLYRAQISRLRLRILNSVHCCSTVALNVHIPKNGCPSNPTQKNYSFLKKKNTCFLLVEIFKNN